MILRFVKRNPDLGADTAQCRTHPTKLINQKPFTKKHAENDNHPPHAPLQNRISLLNLCVLHLSQKLTNSLFS
jgi:hypothetical protein